jgi:retron-type reverse transcriptase
MGLLSILFGGGGSYDARKVDRILGPWRPHGGCDVLPRTRLPREVVLPHGLRRFGGEPGRQPLSRVLFPFWLRLDPRLCGYAASRARRGGLYRRVEIPRPGKAPRVLEIPHPFLRFVQRRILARVLEQMDVHRSAHGFRKGRSVFSGAAAHTGRRLVVCLDLRDFFPSISFRRVAGVFRSCGIEETPALLLAGLCCVRGRLPQGAPTSPMISNLVCRRLDSRLAGLARRMEASYTRYADDITLSGDASLLRVLPLVRKIIAEEGFALAAEKTRIMRSGARQRVTGLNVNTKVSVPRTVRRLLRALVHNHVHSPAPSPRMTAFLRGHAAFMRPAHPETAARMERDLERC